MTIYRLWYSDRSGECTVRDVRPIRSTTTTLVAYCSARQAVRTFNKARIVWYVDLDTGEILDV